MSKDEPLLSIALSSCFDDLRIAEEWRPNEALHSELTRQGVKELRKLTLLIILILGTFSSGVFAQGKLTAYTTWDENYIYAAFQVDDPDISGNNFKPFSKPWEDDCVEIFIETDNKHSKGRSKSSYHMAVSAAGGAAFSQGGDDGKWNPKQIFTFKYASFVDGSINNPEDMDVGYTVEMALPWSELGVTPPEPGTMMSFNIIVRMRGETSKFISLSPNVKTEEDIHDASKWVDIVFAAHTFGVSTITIDKIVSARYITRMPLVDGQMKLKEYNKNTSFDLPLPMEVADRPKHQLQKMILTYYYYWYQADERKAAPVSQVRDADGTSLLTDQPIRSAGPWFSYDRVQWHKDELTDIKRAGIDVILPVYRGDAESRAGYANKGLDCLVEALREIKSAKKPYPVVGMYLDTLCMTDEQGNGPSLKSEEAKSALYRMIYNFYSRIPEEFRAQVQMADARADRPCHIVQLSSANVFSGMDESFRSYIEERFRRDFDANILWLGDRDFKEKAPGFDGYCRYGAGIRFGYDDSARIRIATVGAGYDDCAIPGSTTPIRSREGGDAYRADWSKALVKRPNWVILDGWNQFHEGSELCGSRQHGFSYVDATALQSLKFRGPRDPDAKYLRHNLPSVIAPETIYQVDVQIQNDGLSAWRATEGMALSYRWYQGGRFIGDSGVTRPLQKDLLPGHSAEITIGVAPVKGNELLPEGDYELRFEMIRLTDNKWFTALGDDSLTIPVKVGKPKEFDAKFLGVDGPSMMKTAAAYPFTVRVRNDGTSTWKADTFAAAARLFTVTGPTEPKEVALAPVRAAFTNDVEPGQVAEVTLIVDLKDEAGQPVPVWKQSETDWGYQLAFDIWNGGKWLSASGVRQYKRSISVFEADYGANIVACDVPDVIEAGNTINVKLVVKNNGTETWTPDRFGFGCHWYHLDGTEAVWEGDKTPLKTPIKPGEPAIVTAKLTAPAVDGRYILVWDLIDGDKWASTTEISRGGDILATEVTVQNGRLVFADLSQVYDIPATSPDRNRGSGNFDGVGTSFPAEFMPPDAGMGKPNDIYPSGYNWKRQGSGEESSSRISFRYGPKAAGALNAIACAGQAVAVPKAKYAKIHIAAAAIASEQTSSFGLGYQTSTEPVSISIAPWDTLPAQDAKIALSTLHRHLPSGDDRKSGCYLFHYTIHVDATRPLTSIVLPENDKVRVMAITLEKG